LCYGYGVYYCAAGWLCSYPSRKPNPSHASGPATFEELLLGLHFSVVFCILYYIHSFVYSTETSAAISDLLLQYGIPKYTRNPNSDPNPYASNNNNRLTAFVPGTTRVGRYQKKHSAFCLSIGLCCVQAGFPHILSSGFLWSRGR